MLSLLTCLILKSLDQKKNWLSTGLKYVRPVPSLLGQDVRSVGALWL